MIAVNGTQAKSSKEIKPGDSIELRRRNSLTKVKVLSVPDKKQLSKTEAAEIFEVVSTEQFPELDPLA